MKDEMTLNERCSKIVDVNGNDFQFEIAIEEASEFIHAVQKMKRYKGKKYYNKRPRNKASIKDVINEMADVLVTFKCLRISIDREYKESFNIDKLIDDIMRQKTAWIEEYDGQSDTSLTWQDFKDK